MELCFEICTNERCKVYVKDNTVEDPSKGYIPESSDVIAKGRFKFSDTGLVSIIYLERYDDKDKKVVNVVFNKHDYEKKSEGHEIKINFDGVFTVYNVVLPTDDWFQRMLLSNPDALLIYDTLYTVDAEAGYVYKYVKKEDTGDVVTIDSFDRTGASAEELIERNPEGTTISVDCGTFVSVCFLLHCYLSLCQAIFEDQGFSQCFTRNEIDSQLVWKRDTVWMALNVIRYLTEFNRLQEVQRIIELIGGCNGLCTGWYEHEKLKPDCGCGGLPRRGCNCSGN